MGYATKTSQDEKREANRNDRIDLTIYMATTPKENLPKGVANKWSADLMKPGSREEAALRKFLQEPGNQENNYVNKFVLFFETKKGAIDYARALDALLGRSGVLSDILITVSPADEVAYTPGPGQKYMIFLEAYGRDRIPPLKAREDVILGKFRDSGESLKAVPSKKTGADKEFIARAEGALRSNDPLYGDIEDSDLEKVPQKAEKGVAKIVPLPLKFKDSEGDMLALIPGEKLRKDVEEARRDGTEYSFTLMGNSRVDAFLAAHGKENVEVEDLGNRKFRLTINKLSDWEKKLREIKGEG